MCEQDMAWPAADRNAVMDYVAMQEDRPEGAEAQKGGGELIEFAFLRGHGIDATRVNSLSARPLVLSATRVIKQGQIHKDLRCFNGQFHTLDDVWELDLKTNTWKCLLPAGRLDPRRLMAAAWFPSVQGLALLESIDGSQAGPGVSRGWLLREATGYALEKLPYAGQPSRLPPRGPGPWTPGPVNSWSSAATASSA